MGWTGKEKQAHPKFLHYKSEKYLEPRKKNNRSTVKHTNIKHTAVGWAPKKMARIIPKADIILFPARLINTIKWDLHTAKWSFQSRADSSYSQPT